MNTEEQVEVLEANMVESRHFVDVKNSMIKLQKNKDFKKVVIEYYFKEEAARLVMAKSSSLTEEQQVVIDKMIYGIGSLAKFFDSVLARGVQSEQQLAEDEETKALLIQEGLA
jgi:competence CoiA-like predicted nuclease